MLKYQRILNPLISELSWKLQDWHSAEGREILKAAMRACLD